MLILNYIKKKLAAFQQYMSSESKGGDYMYAYIPAAPRLEVFGREVKIEISVPPGTARDIIEEKMLEELTKVMKSGGFLVIKREPVFSGTDNGEETFRSEVIITSGY